MMMQDVIPVYSDDPALGEHPAILRGGLQVFQLEQRPVSVLHVSHITDVKRRA